MTFIEKEFTRVFRLTTFLAVLDVVTTILAFMYVENVFESNRYTASIMSLFGFYPGLLITLLIIILPVYFVVRFFPVQYPADPIVERWLTRIGYHAIWGFCFTRFMPIINNTSYLVGFFILHPSILKSWIFFIAGLIFSLLRWSPG